MAEKKYTQKYTPTCSGLYLLAYLGIVIEERGGILKPIAIVAACRVTSNRDSNALTIRTRHSKLGDDPAVIQPIVDNLVYGWGV
jgi:hypothetical protein